MKPQAIQIKAVEIAMAIVFREENRIFALETAHTTYQMKVDDYGFLLHLYYGGKVSGDMDYLLTYSDRGFSGNPYDAGLDRTYSMDVLPQEYPGLGIGDFRSSAVAVRNGDGSECCDLRYVSHEIRQGKYGLKGLPAVHAQEQEAQTLEILLEDPVSKVQVRLLYGVLEREDIITRSAVIRNGGSCEITVEKAASACLDFVTGEYDLLGFYGRHAMERNLQRTRVNHGIFRMGSRRGTSSHQYNPAVILAQPGTTEDAGGCWGMIFVYSGNFLCEAERDQFDQTRVLMGLSDELFHYPLNPGESLIVPETILGHTEEGLGTLSRMFHRCIRNHICRGKYAHETRPVLLNSWEASYFDFSGETICALARDAAALGMDMVVMDDGWFGKRDDDNSGLGDWTVNEEKLGCTLGEMIGRINALGVKFGIWVEPEMVSEDSELYRAHPDWALRIPGRGPVRGRNQLVLDFSRQDVKEYIFDRICAVLDQGNIEYVKWDMNRSITDVYSGENCQGRVLYDYMAGVYDFLERLTSRYPHILIEGCSGGGGRFDAGMLYYSPQIWTSDNTDPIERLSIQFGASLCYPVSSMGAHVSANPRAGIATKGAVAMMGTFGYELDPRKLTEEEREAVKSQAAAYHKDYELIREGDLYRLTDSAENRNFCDWEFVSPDKERALFTRIIVRRPDLVFQTLRLRGLDPEKLYLEEETGRICSGALLMSAGPGLCVNPWATKDGDCIVRHYTAQP